MSIAHAGVGTLAGTTTHWVDAIQSVYLLIAINSGQGHRAPRVPGSWQRLHRVTGPGFSDWSTQHCSRSCSCLPVCLIQRSLGKSKVSQSVRWICRRIDGRYLSDLAWLGPWRDGGSKYCKPISFRQPCSTGRAWRCRPTDISVLLLRPPVIFFLDKSVQADFAFIGRFMKTLFDITFIARRHTDARYWYINSVCPSACPSVWQVESVRDVLLSDDNGLTYCHSFLTVR